MASNVSRGWLEPELNDMSFGRTHDQATSGGEIHDRDCPWLWSKELSDKRTRTLTSLDQTERIEGLCLWDRLLRGPGLAKYGLTRREKQIAVRLRPLFR